MRKRFLYAIVLVLFHFYGNAQSRVFKEVSEEISTRVVSIRQDNELVGYLSFTQLEKVSEDSSKYRVTLLDENLNDLNTYNFKDKRLFLQSVALEQDVLCIIYFRSEVIGKEFDNLKEYKNYVKGHSTNSDIIVQFLDINCTLLKQSVIPMELSFSDRKTDKGEIAVVSSMKEEVQLKNIPQQGFALFCGDDARNMLTVYKPDGSMSWQKLIKENGVGYVLLTSAQAVYLLMMKPEMKEQAEYDLLCYHIKDSVKYPKYEVRGTNGNSFEAISFTNDPSTGLPCLSGYIVNRKRGDISYKGLFTFNFKATTEVEPQVIASHWAFVKQVNLPLEERKAVTRATFSFKDYEGNTYFTGMSFESNDRKARTQPSTLIKLDTNATLFLESSIPNSKGADDVHPLYRSYAAVYNRSAGSCYFINSDSKVHSIYDIKGKKVSRTVPVSDKGSRIGISPAKDGHIMVLEYNKKEKYTRVSIESI